MPLKILQVNKFHFQKGGSESVYFGISELLADHGHQVIHFAMKDPRNVPSEYQDFFVENVDYDRPGLAAKLSAASKIIYSFDARSKMKALLSRVRPDVAHFHIFQHQISPSVFGPLRNQKVPIILTLHDLKPLCPNYKMLNGGRICENCKGRRFYHCLLGRCSKGSLAKSLVSTVEMYFHYAMKYYQSVDLYLAPSHFFREKMIEFGFSADKVLTLPNFLTADKLSQPYEGGSYLLYCGRLSEEKGIETLLKAATLTRSVPLVIVGGGPLEASLREKVVKFGLDNVELTGFKQGAELRRLVNGALATVVPSEWYENCPMSVLEALAAGKPVIGSRIGGIPELIDNGVNGFTFEAGNAEELAERIELLWKQPEQVHVLGRNGRRKILSNYTSAQYYEKLISIYKRLL